MSIEYQFIVSTDRSASHLLGAIHQRFDLPWSQDHTFLSGVGLQVNATACGQSYGEMLEDGFGLHFDVGARFRLAKDPDERQVGFQTMLQVVVALLRQEPRQAVLLFNDETILLQRLDGELVLNSDWQGWQKYALEMITVPYRMQSLPSPLL